MTNAMPIVEAMWYEQLVIFLILICIFIIFCIAFKHQMTDVPSKDEIREIIRDELRRIKEVY